MRRNKRIRLYYANEIDATAQLDEYIFNCDLQAMGFFRIYIFI